MPSTKLKRKIKLTPTNPNQYILDPNVKAGARSRKDGITIAIEMKNPVYFCPFCLFYGRIEQFEFKTPKGNISKRLECPDCKNMMLRRTLEQKMNAEQYAEWVFDYRLSGFWQKCNFKVWKERLYKLGLSHKFWEKYKLLKGELRTNEPQDYDENFAQKEWTKYKQQEKQEDEQWEKYRESMKDDS